MGKTANGQHKNTAKYRCKLCGAYISKDIRYLSVSKIFTTNNFGVMVCPAVNAYSSVEPGVLIPFLSEMNNFVPYYGDTY